VKHTIPTESYSIKVTDESMMPKMTPGDTMVFDQKFPGRNDADAIFFKNGETESVIVRRLLASTDTHWTVEQYNPPKTYDLDRALWPICHRLSAIYYGDGPVCGSDPDPIFAAIERHREALAALDSACSRTDNVTAKQQGRRVTRAEERALRAADKAEVRALCELLATTPTTVNGARRAMKYLRAFDSEDLVRAAVGGKFLPALMKSALLAA
jgi:hypothetical protein